MTVTIQEILQNPNKIGVLKAGQHGVYRIIRSVTVMDAPDIHNWLRSDQLLLTTGYVIKDDINAQKKLITDLAKFGCAGIAIKTKRFLKEIHPSVTELADQLDFPIIELPVDCHFSDVMDNVLSKILYPRNDNMQHTLNVHHQLRQLILNGSDISVIANKLEDLLHSGIIFLGAKGDVIANSNRIQKKYPSIVAHIQQYILSVSFKRKMLQTNNLVVNGKSFPITAYPVFTRKMIRSFIILTEIPEDTVERYLTILEQTATVLTFEQMKKEAVLENERKKQLDFFSSCLEKPFLSNDDMLLGKAHGLIDAAYTCIIAQLPNKKLGRDLPNLLRDQIEQHILPAFPNTIVIEKKSEYILLIPCPHHYAHCKENSIAAKLEQCLAELSNWLEKAQAFPFKLGVGGRYPLLADLPKSFKEAQEALISGYQSKVTPKIRYYKTKEVIELLRYIPQNKIEELYSNTLGKFDVLKGQDREETLQTLFMYLENNCNIAETAKQLYIHRNTVLYRLEKCEELLDYSLKNPEKNLLLRIMLRASELFTLSQ
jgi:PucR family transcriptional regulator, purine catabolism regulatory protein